MQTKCKKRLLSRILCIMLIVAMALCTNGCNGKTKEESPSASEKEVKTDDSKALEEGSTEFDLKTSDSKTLGEGSTKFDFIVVDKDGKKTQFEIHTDKKTVGEALLEVNLIEGEESEYGLYVKTVNKVTADYDKDGMYWAFYINDEYALTGVSSTKITEEEHYSFKME